MIAFSVADRPKRRAPFRSAEHSGLPYRVVDEARTQTRTLRCPSPIGCARLPALVRLRTNRINALAESPPECRMPHA